jgi:hypothetical protein
MRMELDVKKVLLSAMEIIALSLVRLAIFHD